MGLSLCFAGCSGGVDNDDNGGNTDIVLPPSGENDDKTNPVTPPAGDDDLSGGTNVGSGDGTGDSGNGGSGETGGSGSGGAGDGTEKPTIADGTYCNNWVTVENSVVTRCNKSATGAIEIPNGVTSIKEWAFRDCNGLTSVTIPAGVTSIGDSAFSYCSSLATVEFKGTTAQWAAITKGSSWNDDVPATTVTCLDGTADLDYTLTIDENGVLTKCTGSANGTVIIPDGVTSIGYIAFYDCSSLTSVTIPDSVKSIGKWAFSGCSNLATVNYGGMTEQWAAITKGDYWHYNVPAETKVTCSGGEKVSLDYTEE